MRKMGIVLRVLGYLLLAPLVIVAWLGLLRLDILPQYIAQLVLEWIGPTIFLILLIGLAVTFRRWLRDRRRAFLLPVVIVGAAVLACGYTLGSYIAVARNHGISVDLVRAVVPQSFRGEGRDAESFIYDRYDGEDARLYVYSPPSGHTGGAPVLVYVHGGGWTVGAPQGRDRDMQWFADRGYLVVGVEYALSSDNRHLWNVTQPQIACALAWIGKNAARFGGDARRIAMFGESAGGNLVLNVGNLVNEGELASRCGGDVPPVKAVVSIYPPVDLAALYRHPPASYAAQAYLGGSPEEFPARYAAVSPIKSTAESNPPSLILTGLDDSTVPARDTLAFVEAARTAGRPVDLIAITRAGHGFDLLPGSIGNQIFRAATLRFLKEHDVAP